MSLISSWKSFPRLVGASDKSNPISANIELTQYHRHIWMQFISQALHFTKFAFLLNSFPFQSVFDTDWHKNGAFSHIFKLNLNIRFVISMNKLKLLVGNENSFYKIQENSSKTRWSDLFQYFISTIVFPKFCCDWQYFSEIPNSQVVVRDKTTHSSLSKLHILGFQI